VNLNFLEFEQPIAELEAKIEELRFVGDDSAVNITEEITRLQAKSRQLTEMIFSNLSAWQVAQIARHPQRPYTLDYIGRIFTDWEEASNFTLPSRLSTKRCSLGSAVMSCRR